MDNNIILSIIKWIAIFLLIVAIIGSGFFTTIITSITSTVNDINSSYLVYVPTQILVPIVLIILGIIVSIAYVFFD